MSEHKNTVEVFTDVTDGACDEIKVTSELCLICAIRPPFNKHACCGAWVCDVCVVRSKNCAFCQATNDLFDQQKSDMYSSIDVAHNKEAETAYQTADAIATTLMLQSFANDLNSGDSDSDSDDSDYGARWGLDVIDLTR